MSIDYEKSIWQYKQVDDIFCGATYSSGELCMKRPEMPEGFIDESTIIGVTSSTSEQTTNSTTTSNTTSTTNTVNPLSISPKTLRTSSIPITSTTNESTQTEPTTESTIVEESTEDTVDKKALLSTPNWQLIASMVKDGSAKSTFSVGDAFTSTITQNDTTKKFPWIVADFANVVIDDNSNVVEAMILIAKYATIQRLPFDNGGNNSYYHSIIRQYLNSDSENPDWFTKQSEDDVDYTPEIPGFISCLPKDFVEVVKPVVTNSILTKKYQHTEMLDGEEVLYPVGLNYYTACDKFWIPSVSEMNSNIEPLEREHIRPLQYFVDLSNNMTVELGAANSSYKMKRANATSTAVTYWTMTPELDGTDNAYACFASNGAINSNPVSDTFAIIPICAIW